ncbi:MAG: hypothetical protein WEB88_04400 [Gemmatimonadota bacterium]
MKFAELLDIVGDLPLFRGSLLLAGDHDPADVRRQLSRWKAAGKVVQLRRNLYALASPWRRAEPHPFLVANELHGPSYVSLQSALAHYGMIPESVPVTTSVTTGRPIQISTPFGLYAYRHLRRDAFFGYRQTPVFRNQESLVATPAKALLDLSYLTPGGASMAHLKSLRLDGLEQVHEDELLGHARRWGKPAILKAAENILRLREGPAGGDIRP